MTSDTFIVQKRCTCRNMNEDKIIILNMVESTTKAASLLFGSQALCVFFFNQSSWISSIFK